MSRIDRPFRRRLSVLTVAVCAFLSFITAERLGLSDGVLVHNLRGIPAALQPGSDAQQHGVSVSSEAEMDSPAST